jgi:hypothetical protein
MKISLDIKKTVTQSEVLDARSIIIKFTEVQFTAEDGIEYTLHNPSGEARLIFENNSFSIDGEVLLTDKLQRTGGSLLKSAKSSSTLSKKI